MSLSEQPFERHPALASWIERLANSQSGLSLGEWMIFLGSLNHALNAARAEGAPYEPTDAEIREGESLDSVSYVIRRGETDETAFRRAARAEIVRLRRAISDRAEGVAALQQAGEHVAEVGNLIDLPTGPVAWARSTVIRDRDGYAIGSDEPEVHWGPTYPEDETGWLPLFALPQQTALVEPPKRAR